jgi:hypothetical protein
MGMKVKELIEQLLACNQEQFVYVYNFNERYEIVVVDELDDCVDICGDNREEW